MELLTHFHYTSYSYNSFSIFVCVAITETLADIYLHESWCAQIVSTVPLQHTSETKTTSTTTKNRFLYVDKPLYETYAKREKRRRKVSPFFVCTQCNCMLLFFVILREYIQIQHSQTRCKHARPKWIAYFALYLDLLNIYFYNSTQKLRTILKSHFYSIFNVPFFQFIQVNSYPNWIQMSFECTRASESGYWTPLFAHPKIRLGLTSICMRR